MQNYILLSEEEKQKFFQVVSSQKYSTPALYNIIENLECTPLYKIFIGENIWYFSQILLSPARMQCIGYIFNNGLWMMRAFYKSQSDGGWRVCVGSYNGWYIKGNNIHYTQETKLYKDILLFLESIEAYSIKTEIGYIEQYFQIYKGSDKTPNKDMSLMDTFNQEVFLYNDEGVLHSFQSVLPGKSFSRFFSTLDYIESINWNAVFLKDFFPIFDEPKDSYRAQHSLLGEVYYEVYYASLHDQTIAWTIGYDLEKRVWIDRISFVDDVLSSYGTNTSIINSGMLTCKPLEYISQCQYMMENIDYIPFNETYNDISLFLDQMPIVQKFRNERNIFRPKY